MSATTTTNPPFDLTVTLCPTCIRATAFKTDHPGICTDCWQEDVDRTGMGPFCFVTFGGECYHGTPACPHVAGNPHRMLTAEGAVCARYRPCSLCWYQTLDEEWW